MSNDRSVSGTLYCRHEDVGVALRLVDATLEALRDSLVPMPELAVVRQGDAHDEVLGGIEFLAGLRSSIEARRQHESVEFVCEASAKSAVSLFLPPSNWRDLGAGRLPIGSIGYQYALDPSAESLKSNRVSDYFKRLVSVTSPGYGRCTLWPPPGNRRLLGLSLDKGIADLFWLNAFGVWFHPYIQAKPDLGWTKEGDALILRLCEDYMDCETSAARRRRRACLRCFDPRVLAPRPSLRHFSYWVAGLRQLKWASLSPFRSP
jgi:hypothetical protein